MKPIYRIASVVGVAALLVAVSAYSYPASNAVAFKFRTLASDPSSPSNGDVWYNTAGNAFKFRQNGSTVGLSSNGNFTFSGNTIDLTGAAQMLIGPTATSVLIGGTGAAAVALTAGVIISDRGGSQGVIGANDSQNSGFSGVALLGGSGGNGLVRFGDSSGSPDTSLFRSGVGALTVGTGAASGTGNLTVNTLTATTYSGLPAYDAYLSAYDPADNSTSNTLQTFVVSKASTLADGSFTTTVVGATTGSYVVKLCSDGATCSGANLKGTLTVSCTAAAGTVTAITINNASIAAASTLTLRPSTACNTTAESGNFTFHLTQ